MPLSKEDKQALKFAVGVTVLTGATAFLFTRYKTSKSNEWLVS